MIKVSTKLFFCDKESTKLMSITLYLFKYKCDDTLLIHIVMNRIDRYPIPVRH